VQQLLELKGANIIDGGGNDSHMMTPPTQRELKTFALSKITHHASYLRYFIKSESLLSPLVRTSAEWFGMSGLSFADTQKIFLESMNVYSHWQQESQLRKDWDLFDFKTDIYSTRTIAEVHIRKARNFSDSIHSNLILPFASQQVAEYFAKMPEEYLFDRKTLKNKLILRKILKERNVVDSDAIGKMGWNYDSSSIVLQNWAWMFEEIQQCELWDQSGIEEVAYRMKNRMNGSGWGSAASARLLYRLFLVSAWYKNNKYLN
jgi:asparagine synthase (glutamine-hydrolysing)